MLNERRLIRPIDLVSAPAKRVTALATLVASIPIELLEVTDSLISHAFSERKDDIQTVSLANREHLMCDRAEIDNRDCFAMKVEDDMHLGGHVGGA